MNAMEDDFYYCERYLESMLPKKRKTMNEGCKHGYITKSDDGWYVCGMCHEELRYNPNKRPVTIEDICSEMMRQRRWKHRIKGLTKWLGAYNFPFEDELLVDFSSFINEYTKLYPDRKNLISKDYILYHLLRMRGYDLQVKVPKMEKTLIQNEQICKTIFEALNWGPISGL